MKEFVGCVSSKGQVTLPAEIRTRLGIKPKDKVIFSFDDGVLTVRRLSGGLRAGFQSIPALKQHLTLDEITEIAADEAAEEANSPA